MGFNRKGQRTQKLAPDWKQKVLANIKEAESLPGHTMQSWQATCKRWQDRQTTSNAKDLPTLFH